jgi:cobalamin biosynthesis Mg chelatase CobN
MSRKFIRTASVLASLGVSLLLMVPAHAAAAAPSVISVPAAVQAQTTPPTPTDAPTGVTPAPTGAATPSEGTPTGFGNPGTGETQQAEDARLDMAPIVIGAILLVVLIVVVIWRRRRKDTTIV